MIDDSKLATADAVVKGQTQQDALRRPDDIAVVGAETGEQPQAGGTPSEKPADAASDEA